MARYVTLNVAEKCVMARIRRHNRLHQETFTLRKFGSYAKAEAAAKKWVKAKLSELPDPLPVKDRKTTRNTSGVVGVRLADATRRKNGNVYPDWRWVGFWPGCPNTGGVGWSVKKYGDNHAFVCACLARKAESIDRQEIEARFLKLKTTQEYRRILRLKKISPP